MGNGKRQMRLVTHEAFVGHAMEEFGSMVYTLAYSRTQNVADAQDVAQDVFVRLLTSDAAFTDDEHVKAWLIRVTINRCRELHRSAWNKRAVTTDELALLEGGTEPEADVADAALEELERNELWQKILTLPEELRDVVVLYYVHGLTSAEIARALNRPPATIRTRLHRARQQLKAALADKEIKDETV